MYTSGKPQLRGLHLAKAKRDIYGALAAAITAGSLYILFRQEPRKRRVAEFHKQYDGKAAAEKMRDAGLLQSWPVEKQ